MSLRIDEKKRITFYSLNMHDFNFSSRKKNNFLEKCHFVSIKMYFNFSIPFNFNNKNQF